MAVKGVKLGEMQARLLKKIEELTLYTLQQQREIELLKKWGLQIKDILYERIKQRFSSMSMSTQGLLEPVALEFSPKELELLRSSLETLRELNFEIDEMGKDSYYVKGIPIILGRMLEPEYIHDIINDLINIRKEKEHDIIKDKMIQTMACKAAIKAGKPLNIPEIQQLLRELYGIENPFTCAHGRPTIISLTDIQLQKLFKRIV